MAIHRGIQSALFFYLSCAPCSEARYRKKRRQEAISNRAERDALEEEMPDIYRHPEPSSTNPYWEGEIAMGPKLVQRGNKARTGAAGKKASREVLSSNTSMNGASSLDLNALQQREDERLWGTIPTTATEETMVDGAGSTINLQRPPQAARRRGLSNETSTTAGTTTTAYSNYRSPPVSDLLPPIVRTVHSREEVAWMMQPPPVADIMSGKERESGGLRSGASSRRSSARMARTVSRGSSGGVSSVLHVVGESPRSIPADLRRPSSRGGDVPDMATVLIAPTMRRVASRPPLLSTIASEATRPSADHEESQLQLIDSAKSQPKQPQATPTKTLGRNRARSNSYPKKARVLEGRIFTATDSSSPEHSSSSPSHPDHNFYREGGEVREELFDSWYTPDFELGRWVHEHTKREGIRERWSFDV